MDTVSTLVILIVPPSFTSRPSPLATEVVPLEVPPSIKLISAAVVVIFVPASEKVPLISQVPLISIAVAVKSISSVAPIDNTVALDPCKN